MISVNEIRNYKLNEYLIDVLWIKIIINIYLKKIKYSYYIYMSSKMQ